MIGEQLVNKDFAAFTLATCQVTIGQRPADSGGWSIYGYS